MFRLRSVLAREMWDIAAAAAAVAGLIRPLATKRLLVRGSVVLCLWAEASVSDSACCYKEKGKGYINTVGIFAVLNG